MRMITVKDVAEQLSVSTGVIYNLVMSGQIRAVRVGPRMFRFTQESVDDYIANNTVTSQDDILRSVLTNEAAEMVLKDDASRRGGKDAAT